MHIFWTSFLQFKELIGVFKLAHTNTTIYTSTSYFDLRIARLFLVDYDFGTEGVVTLSLPPTMNTSLPSLYQQIITWILTKFNITNIHIHFLSYSQSTTTTQHQESTKGSKNNVNGIRNSSNNTTASSRESFQNQKKKKTFFILFRRFTGNQKQNGKIDQFFLWTGLFV